MEFKTVGEITEHPLWGKAFPDHYLSEQSRMWHMKIPVVPGVHQRTLDSIAKDGRLQMGTWHGSDSCGPGSADYEHHFCGTVHCRAGWATHYAGSRGMWLEVELGPRAAAMLIILASCPRLDRVPDFYCTDSEALAEIKRQAVLELALEVESGGDK